MTQVTTLGELKKTEWASPARRQRTVKAEMRENLICLLENGSPLFPGIVGYEETVLPQLVNAILSRHNFILLGLRGQAKSRILRQLVTLLDDEIPILAGSEVNDDPFDPISKYGRELIAEHGDGTPIAWLSRELRFVEKLAIPDVTIADIIGDVDPIKAARGGHLLSDELTMHFGLLPRANRGIFAINELPDLAGKIQVGLFNIMQEGDVQIKGYPVRLNLDVALVFTANPEDYTARGKIITPLKDRIGSEVVTHYPHTVELGAAITRQEAWLERTGRPLKLPDFVAELIERVAFEAREDKRVDRRSGVSQRLPISVLENVVSNAERRTVVTKEKTVVPRVSDIYAALPAITGKLELEYEGELQGPEVIAKDLIRRAAGKTFAARVGGANVDDIVHWFDEGGALKISIDERSAVPQGLQCRARPARPRRPGRPRGKEGSGDDGGGVRARTRRSRGREAHLAQRGARLHARPGGAQGSGLREAGERRAEPLLVTLGRGHLLLVPLRSAHGQARRWCRPAVHRVLPAPHRGYRPLAAPWAGLQPAAPWWLRGRRLRAPDRRVLPDGGDRRRRGGRTARLRHRGPGAAARRHSVRPTLVLDRAVLDARGAVAHARRADRVDRGAVQRADGDARRSVDPVADRPDAGPQDLHRDRRREPDPRRRPQRHPQGCARRHGAILDQRHLEAHPDRHHHGGARRLGARDHPAGGGQQIPDRHGDGVLPARPAASRPSGSSDQQQDRPGAADRDRAASRRSGTPANGAAAAPEPDALSRGAHQAVDRSAARYEGLIEPHHLRADRRRAAAPQHRRSPQEPEALRCRLPSSP